VEPKTTTILILSMLNAIERWYHPKGELSRDALIERVTEFSLDGLR